MGKNQFTVFLAVCILNLWKTILLVRKKIVNIEPLLRNASRRSISQKAKPFVEGNFTCLAFGEIKET